jgi:hypothetical protein
LEDWTPVTFKPATPVHDAAEVHTSLQTCAPASIIAASEPLQPLCAPMVLQQSYADSAAVTQQNLTPDPSAVIHAPADAPTSTSPFALRCSAADSVSFSAPEYAATQSALPMLNAATELLPLDAHPSPAMQFCMPSLPAAPQSASLSTFPAKQATADAVTRQSTQFSTQLHITHVDTREHPIQHPTVPMPPTRSPFSSTFVQAPQQLKIPMIHSLQLQCAPPCAPFVSISCTPSAACRHTGTPSFDLKPAIESYAAGASAVAITTSGADVKPTISSLVWVTAPLTSALQPPTVTEAPDTAVAASCRTFNPKIFPAAFHVLSSLDSASRPDAQENQVVAAADCVPIALDSPQNSHHRPTSAIDNAELESCPILVELHSPFATECVLDTFEQAPVSAADADFVDPDKATEPDGLHFSSFLVAERSGLEGCRTVPAVQHLVSEGCLGCEESGRCVARSWLPRCGLAGKYCRVN